MSEVIEFKGKDEPPKKLIFETSCKCLVCSYEFPANVEEGVVLVECPVCKEDFARVLGVADRGGYHWMCHCSSFIFYIGTDGPYCARCGVLANDWQK
jgi:hypothetical protein